MHFIFGGYDRSENTIRSFQLHFELVNLSLRFQLHFFLSNLCHLFQLHFLQLTTFFPSSRFWYLRFCSQVHFIFPTLNYCFQLRKLPIQTSNSPTKIIPIHRFSNYPYAKLRRRTGTRTRTWTRIRTRMSGELWSGFDFF